MVSKRHLFDRSLHVWELETGPLYRNVPLKLHWLRAIPPNRGTQYQRERLIQSMKGLMESLIDLGGEGGPLGAGSINNYFQQLRRVVAWMTGRGIWAFRDLKPSDVVDYFACLQEGRERPLCENTVWAKEALFSRMWHLREKYLMPLQFNPFVVESEIRRIVKTRRAEPWRHLDEELALPLLKDALDWIRVHGPAIKDMVRKIWAERRAHVGLKKGAVSKRVRSLYLAILSDPAIQKIASELQIEGAHSGVVLTRIMTATEGACIVALLFLVGMRASELTRLDANCLMQLGEPGVDQRTVLQGIAAKRRGMQRTWPASDHTAEVVQFLVDLYAEIRSFTGQSSLLLGKTSATPIPLPGRKLIRFGPEALPLRMHAFVNSPHRGAGSEIRLHAHMARKTFARFVVMRDKSALESLSYHFGHVNSAITDGSYIGVDVGLAKLLREEDRKDLAEALMDLLSSGALGGKAGKSILKVTDQASSARTAFRGKRSLRVTVDRLIDKGVRLAPCDWGYCVYSMATSACGGDEMGPNSVRRAPDVCATCSNFSVTERHKHYWNERLRRDEEFLKRPGLSDQTKQVVLARAVQSQGVLESLTPTPAFRHNEED